MDGASTVAAATVDGVAVAAASVDVVAVAKRDAAHTDMAVVANTALSMAETATIHLEVDIPDETSTENGSLVATEVGRSETGCSPVETSVCPMMTQISSSHYQDRPDDGATTEEEDTTTTWIRIWKKMTPTTNPPEMEITARICSTECSFTNSS